MVVILVRLEIVVGGLSVEATSGRQIVGVFVGSIDSTKKKFVATPAEVVTSKYTFLQS